MTTPSQPPQVAHGLPVTPRTSEAAGYPSNDWHATADRLFICSQQLEEELAAQQAELLALRADKLRLDWLEKHANFIEVGHMDIGATRAEIDAALNSPTQGAKS